MAADLHKIIIAVGSTRKPKIAAVQEALTAIGELLGSVATFEVKGVEIASGVSLTPSSREESMLGARQRAEGVAQIAQQNCEPWNFFVGLEGGLDIISENGKRRVFLESWAY